MSRLYSGRGQCKMRLLVVALRRSRAENTLRKQCLHAVSAVRTDIKVFVSSIPQLEYVIL